MSAASAATEPAPSASALVLFARVEAPADLDALGTRLAGEHPGRLFALVVALEDPGLLRRSVEELATVSRELVLTDSVPERPGRGDRLAWFALDELGVGQDFVYTVASLEHAVDHASRAIAPDADARWDADAVLVIGSQQALVRARRHLQAGADEFAGPPKSAPQAR